MKRKFQVFVSSTYKDLVAERQAAVQAILRAGHIPAGMELFAASDKSQWKTIQNWIDDSDVFLLILGGRYGSIEPESGKSYIELEYDYAIQQHKPYFALYIDEGYLHRKATTDSSVNEKDNPELLSMFREKVMSSICRSFEDNNSIAASVFHSMSDFEQRPDLLGWVRGSKSAYANLEVSNEVNAESSITDICRHLSTESQVLLVDASETGEIMYFESDGRAEIKASHRSMLRTRLNQREVSRWIAALTALTKLKLIENRTQDGKYFTMTPKGYEASEFISTSMANPKERLEESW